MIARILVFALLSAILAASSPAETLAVRPGSAWDGLAARAKPGDEIILEPGVHLPVRLEGLAGEPGRPIVIRPRDVRTAVEIRGGLHGLELRGPRHVEVRNVLFRDSSREGLLIEGDAAAPARGILIQNCLLSRCGVATRSPAFRFRGVEGLTLADSVVRGFEDASVAMERCREVRIERFQAVADGTETDRTGIRIGPGSDGVAIDRIGLSRSIRTAFSIGVGTSAETDDLPPGPLSSRITVRNALVDRNAVFAAVGSARDVDLSRNTIIDPLDTTLLLLASPEGRPDGSRIRFRGNLVSWTPNTLQRFTRLGPGVEGTPDVEFGANLWHSAELPAARPLLGEWQGRVLEPQVTDLDPRLDNSFSPRERAAGDFGFEIVRSPKPAGHGDQTTPAPAR